MFNGSRPKYPLRIEGNMAYGAGVADDKSSLNAAWWVIKTLPETVSKKLRIGFVINLGEESGNATIGAFLRQLGKKTPAVLVFEPGREGNGCVMERKGAMWLTFTFKGLSAHAGNNPGDGRNAIEAMCLAVPQIKAIEDRYPDVTLNTDVVEGGTAVNVIADRAVVKFDFRFFSDESRDRVLADINALCKKGFAPGVTVEMKGGRSSAMSLTPASRALRDLVNEAARASGQPEPKWLRVGGASDGNQFSGAGAAVVCGMGVVGGNLHNVEKEWSDLSTVWPRIQLNQGVLKLMAQRK